MKNLLDVGKLSKFSSLVHMQNLVEKNLSFAVKTGHLILLLLRIAVLYRILIENDG